jgi:hypothetical protein
MESQEQVKEHMKKFWQTAREKAVEEEKEYRNSLVRKGKTQGKEKDKGKDRAQGSLLPGALSNPMSNSLLDVMLELPVHPSVKVKLEEQSAVKMESHEEKKKMKLEPVEKQKAVKTEMHSSSSARPATVTSTTVRLPKRMKCKSKARLQKKKDNLKAKRQLAKEQARQEKMQNLIAQVDSQARQRERRLVSEVEAEQWCAEMTKEELSKQIKADLDALDSDSERASGMSSSSSYSGSSSLAPKVCSPAARKGRQAHAQKKR